MLYTDTDPNRAGSRGFKAALQALGVQIAAEQTFEPDQTDFSPQLDEIATSQPDALFINAPSSVAAPILIQARQRGFKSVPIIGSNAFNSDTVLRSAGEAAEGLIVGSAWSASNPTARNQQFIQSYHARYGVDPDQLAAQAYTGVYLVATALRDAGSTSDPRAVRDALERIKQLDTPLGAFSFNASRDRVWKAWTERDQLLQWFGPKGFKMTTAKLDLRPGGTLHYCLRSPDGKEIWAANAQDGTISIIDFAAKKVTQTLAANVRGANRLKFTLDGKLAFVSMLAGPDLVVFDAAARREAKRIPVGHGAAGILMQPDGSRAFVACTPDNYVVAIDLRSLQVTAHIDAGQQPDGLAWARQM